MLYRHFKGGMYYLHGKVQGTSSKILLDSGEVFTDAFMILPDGMLDFCQVLVITDKRSGFTQFIVESDSCGREYCLYQDTMSNYWLRRADEFHGETKNGEKRFTRMTEGAIFATMIDKSRSHAFIVAKDKIDKCK
jgi:hypothetical protein